MHDASIDQHWHEPGKNQKAGKGNFASAALPYDRFMDEDGIPIFRGNGTRRMQDLPRKPWKRMGGLGTYIQLYGTEGRWGLYVLEVPGGGTTTDEKHLYEEIYLVLEGRGSTEVWLEGETKRHIFEWQRGSLFSIPVNACHRIVNGTSSPAILAGGTTAPALMNLIDDNNVIFSNPMVLRDRFPGATDFYKYKEEVDPDPVRGLARRCTNFIPDVMTCELPLDNRRGPGWRRIQPMMTNNKFYLWIGEHQTGRYSKAHKHSSSVALICIKGKGYTYMWHESLGMTPWKDGKGDQVQRVDYEVGGVVSAAPGGEEWFHQHFAASDEPLRLTAWYGPNAAPGTMPGVAPGTRLKDAGAVDIPDGGCAIPYYMEDPFLRQEYEGMLAKVGRKSDMDPRLYTENIKSDFVGA